MDNKRTSVMRSLNKAMRNGEITKEQVSQFMATIGIKRSSFTKHTPTSSQRKAKRKIQKLARRANR